MKKITQSQCKKIAGGTLLAQSVEYPTLDFRVMSLSPIWGMESKLKLLRITDKEVFLKVGIGKKITMIIDFSVEIMQARNTRVSTSKFQKQEINLEFFYQQKYYLNLMAK